MSDYPIHDKDGYLEFVIGMWFNTRALVGKPTLAEVEASLPDWPAHRRGELLQKLARTNQVTPFPAINLV